MQNAENVNGYVFKKVSVVSVVLLRHLLDAWVPLYLSD